MNFFTASTSLYFRQSLFQDQPGRDICCSSYMISIWLLLRFFGEMQLNQSQSPRRKLSIQSYLVFVFFLLEGQRLLNRNGVNIRLFYGIQQLSASFWIPTAFLVYVYFNFFYNFLRLDLSSLSIPYKMLVVCLIQLFYA